MSVAHTPRTREREAGFALLIAVFALLVISGMIVTGTQNGMARDSTSEAATTAPVRAREVALAGAAEALSWFRRQNVQPVTSFSPQLDLLANPPINETMDPAVGLVREYEVTPSVWARYEVRLTKAAESFTDLNANGAWDKGEPYTDDNANGRWDAASGARDISTERGQVADGAVWLVESYGYLFRRPRADLPLGEGANWRVASEVVATEFRRMALKPPAAAAICAARGADVTIGNRARLRGGSGAGAAYDTSTGTPLFESGSEVDGAPSSTAVPSYDGSLKEVFGLTLSDLKAMAEISVSDTSVLPDTLGEYTLTVIEGDVTFDKARPLRGTGILVVNGNCTLASGSNSFFNGLIWVRDKLDVGGPCYLRGICISEGDIEVRGSAGDYAEIEYDGSIIDDLLTRMGTYRRSKAVFSIAKAASSGPEGS